MTQAWEGLACSRGAADAKNLDLPVEGGRIASAVAGEEYADWNPVGHPRPSRQVAKSAGRQVVVTRPAKGPARW